MGAARSRCLSQKQMPLSLRPVPTAALGIHPYLPIKTTCILPGVNSLRLSNKKPFPHRTYTRPGKNCIVYIICAAFMMTASSSRATHSIRSRQRQQEATASTRRRFAISFCSRGDLLSKFPSDLQWLCRTLVLPQVA